MRVGRRVAFLAVAFGPVVACFADLDGFSDGPGAIEAGAEASSADVVAADVLVAPPGADATPEPRDAGNDASWSFVSSDGVQISTKPDGGAHLRSSQLVRTGDLLVLGCDTNGSGGAFTHSLPAEIATLTPIGPVRSPNGDTGLEAVVYTGSVKTAPAGGIIDFIARPSGETGFLDCTLNVYRGGSASFAVVDMKARAGTGAGLVECGPVATTPRGLAFYIAARYNCAGAPRTPFIQRQNLQGNPNGDLVPTDGAVAQTMLEECNGSSGDWVCLTVSVSP